jgi:glycerophosphoryl diester phosphodiesterase
VRSFPLGDRPWFAGHRGALPELENTLASFRRAVSEGASFVECDVQLAADGELVVFHDESLERLAGDLRRVEEVSSAELREVQLASPGASLPAASIPTLTELLAALPPRFPVNVELKRYHAPREALLGAALATLAIRDNLLVSSFDWTLLEHLHETDRSLPLAPIARALTAGTVEAADRIDAAAFHLGRFPDPETWPIATLARPVLIYTVNDPRTARRHLDRGAAGIITDRPGALRTALAGPAGALRAPDPGLAG